MLTIWKFPFEVNDTVKVHFPEGAIVLSVACQRGQPCMWVLVNPSRSHEERTFHIYGTGNPVDESEFGSLVFVGSFQELGGNLVWHMFEDVG